MCLRKPQKSCGESRKNAKEKLPIAIENGKGDGKIVCHRRMARGEDLAKRWRGSGNAAAAVSGDGTALAIEVADGLAAAE